MEVPILAFRCRLEEANENLAIAVDVKFFLADNFRVENSMLRILG